MKCIRPYIRDSCGVQGRVKRDIAFAVNTLNWLPVWWLVFEKRWSWALASCTVGVLLDSRRQKLNSPYLIEGGSVVLETVSFLDFTQRTVLGLLMCSPVRFVCRTLRQKQNCFRDAVIIPYPTAFPYGNGMVLHFYQQQESSTTKTVHKVINKGLKTYV